MLSTENESQILKLSNKARQISPQTTHFSNQGSGTATKLTSKVQRHAYSWHTQPALTGTGKNPQWQDILIQLAMMC